MSRVWVSPMNTHKPPEIIELDVAERQAILDRAAQSGLSSDDLQLIQAVFESYAYVTELIDHKNISLARLRKLLFGASSEKTAAVVVSQDTAGTSGTAASSPAASSGEAEAKPAASEPRTAGHGRHGADDYPGAQRVPVPHASLHAGDRCPLCRGGTLYELANPES